MKDFKIIEVKTNSVVYLKKKGNVRENHFRSIDYKLEWDEKLNAIIVHDEDGEMTIVFQTNIEWIRFGKGKVVIKNKVIKTKTK